MWIIMQNYITKTKHSNPKCSINTSYYKLLWESLCSSYTYVELLLFSSFCSNILGLLLIKHKTNIKISMNNKHDFNDSTFTTKVNFLKLYLNVPENVQVPHCGC